MKFTNVIIFVLSCFAVNPAIAQYDKISDQLDVSIYPKERQSKRTQAYDENKCYEWAGDRVGLNDNRNNSYRDNNYRSYDKNDRRSSSRRNDRYDNNRNDHYNDKKDDKKENKSFVGRTAGGAVIGTLIGALAGDAKKGLLIGTAAGAATGVVGEINEDKGNKRNDRYDDNYRNQKSRLVDSFCSCMEAKGYSARK